MGKHTQNCTLIGKGVYGTIGVDQRSRLADGAHFHTMIVTSTLEASVIEGDKLVIKSGIVRGSARKVAHFGSWPSMAR